MPAPQTRIKITLPGALAEYVIRFGPKALYGLSRGRHRNRGRGTSFDTTATQKQIRELRKYLMFLEGSRIATPLVKKHARSTLRRIDAGDLVTN